MSHHIEVTVRCEYLPAQSQPEKDKFTFAYHVAIENRGDETAQLVSRHWIITDGNGTTREVKGLGVIGEQPVIGPGEHFNYSSFSVLETAVGTMEGSYRMKAQDESYFIAPIAPFLLAVPGTIN